MDLVRSIYSAWEQDDHSSVEWAHPEIEFAMADGPDPGSWTGVDGMMVEGWRAFKSTWEDFRAEVTEYRDLDGEHVLVMAKFHGRAKLSGLDLAQMGTQQGTLIQIRAGRVTRLVLYFDPDRALTDLALSPEGDAP